MAVVFVLLMTSFVGWTVSLPLTDQYQQSRHDKLMQGFYENDSEFLIKHLPGSRQLDGTSQNKLGPTPLWKDGVVPYIIDARIGMEARRIINEAMEEFRSRTCIKFVERTNETDFVKITNEDDGCYAVLGCVGGMQELNLATPGCIHKYVVIHELMHAIGFNHEHVRPDRDNYVDILWENMDPSSFFAFEISDWGTDTWKHIPYDYTSITHYEKYAFTNNDKPTIRPKNISASLGSDRLSGSDIAKIDLLYQCHDHHQYGHNKHLG